MKYLSNIFIILFLGLVACTTGDKSESPAKPNVLFIAVDDLRPNLACYGDSLAISPNIDKLASKGIVFQRAYCQEAVCNPSRASIMTGLRPDQIGVTDLHTHFREKLPDIVTLPQLFAKNGYEAVAIGKIYHGSKNAQDSVSWTKPSRLNLSIKADEYVLPENKTGDKEAAYECSELADTVYEDVQIVDLAVKELAELKKTGTSFFLAVGFKKPHLPFSAPKKYWDLYKTSVFGKISNKERPVGAPDIAFHNSQELRGYKGIPRAGEIGSGNEVNLWHGYYACVSFIDDQLGKIMKQLEELELDKNTIIILWGDHGFHLGEQDLWAKSTNFELDARIPLILSVPEMKNAGSTSESIVEAVDMYPTLADLCGLKVVGELAGRSIKPILSNPAVQIKDEAFSQFIRPYGALNKKAKSHMGYSVRTKDWRCTIWYNLKNDSIEDKELYHLSTDTIEKVNLSGQEEYLEIETELIHMLKNYKNN